jgi:hypothetical protein
MRGLNCRASHSADPISLAGTGVGPNECGRLNSQAVRTGMSGPHPKAAKGAVRALSAGL